jgi:hypothetical protein
MRCVALQTEAEKGPDEMFNYIYKHAATCRETPGHVRMLHAAHAKDVYNPWMQLECAPSPSSSISPHAAPARPRREPTAASLGGLLLGLTAAVKTPLHSAL